MFQGQELNLKGYRIVLIKLASQQWFIKPATRSIDTIYDPRNVNKIYIPHDNVQAMRNAIYWRHVINIKIVC